MKTIQTILGSAFIMAAACSGRAQGTLQFTTYLHGTNVVPPSVLPYDGAGTFMLSNGVLSYDIRTDPLSDFSAAVYGPASPGSNGPLLFDLALPFTIAPRPPFDPGGSWYRGSTNIPSGQVPDLLGGLWYVEIRHPLLSERAMRGQIVPIPEPTTVSFLATGLLGLLVLRRFNSPHQTWSTV